LKRKKSNSDYEIVKKKKTRLNFWNCGERSRKFDSINYIQSYKSRYYVTKFGPETIHKILRNLEKRELAWKKNAQSI